MRSVSVIIPVCNGEATIARAVNSVLAQSFTGTEVIVVNDGSTDGTLKVLEHCRNGMNGIKVISQPNRGLAAARNVGAAASNGAVLAFLDADDAWLPGMLSKTVAALERSPDSVLAYTDLVPIDDSGNPLGPSMIEDRCRHAPSMKELMTRWWGILPSAALLKRETFEACGGFSQEFKSVGFEDFYMWLLARECGPFQFVPEPLVLYRWTPEPQRFEKYFSSYSIFVRLVRDHFGAAGEGLVREVTAGVVSALGYKGLVALREGNRREARRAFLRALRYKPFHLRSILRLLKTYLPYDIAMALTGRTRKLLFDSKWAGMTR
jgi:glycosyltransferase involved in cell wall biosynthesis